MRPGFHGPSKAMSQSKYPYYDKVKSYYVVQKSWHDKYQNPRNQCRQRWQVRHMHCDSPFGNLSRRGGDRAGWTNAASPFAVYALHGQIISQHLFQHLGSMTVSFAIQAAWPALHPFPFASIFAGHRSYFLSQRVAARMRKSRFPFLNLFRNASGQK